MTKIEKLIRRTLIIAGYEVFSRLFDKLIRVDMVEEEFADILKQCKPFTLTSVERMYALYQATKYIIDHDIPGDFVECGVWRGGSSMLMAYTLKKMNAMSRKIYCYDTYAGAVKPGARDVDFKNVSGEKLWSAFETENSKLCFVTLDEVQRNLFSTGYPENNFVFVKGKVEDTIPGTIPEKISLLRLDTDWYESTYHEFLHLFPRLSAHGALIIDDYGYWKGSREATDTYFRENKIKILLNRIDYSGRIGIKV